MSAADKMRLLLGRNESLITTMYLTGILTSIHS